MSVQALVNKRKKNLNHYNVKFGILFISVLQQERLQQSMTVQDSRPSKSNRKAPHCKNCGKAMRGHSKELCKQYRKQ